MRAQLARYCGYITPGYDKGHPFRKAIEKLVADGKIVRRGKYRLTSSEVKANQVAKLDKSNINFEGRMKLSMPKLFEKLGREFPNLHAKCTDLVITVRNGEIQLTDRADELSYEELRFLKGYIAPHILDGEEEMTEFKDECEREEDAPGAENDALDAFMEQFLGENAKLVQSIHLKNENWEFKISSGNIPLKITMDSVSGSPSIYFNNEECV
jgi:hypothetical protein